MDTLPEAPEDGAVDELGDWMKALEGSTETYLDGGRPICVRLDGRAFHTFTRGLDRPFDARLVGLMRATTLHLAEECSAAVAYTQSDEISLVLVSRDNPDADPYFGGRVQKLASVLAATATAYFNRHLPGTISEKAHLMPVFDARVWGVADLETATEVLRWRELDAYRNGVTSLALAHFSAKEIHGKGRAEKLAMLAGRGVRFDALPRHARAGSFLLRRRVSVPFSREELDRLPAKHAARTNPNLTVVRTVRAFADDLPPLSHLANPAQVLFAGEEPVLLGERGGRARGADRG